MKVLHQVTHLSKMEGGIMEVSTTKQAYHLKHTALACTLRRYECELLVHCVLWHFNQGQARKDMDVLLEMSTSLRGPTLQT